MHTDQITSTGRPARSFGFRVILLVVVLVAAIMGGFMVLSCQPARGEFVFPWFWVAA